MNETVYSAAILDGSTVDGSRRARLGSRPLIVESTEFFHPSHNSQ